LSTHYDSDIRALLFDLGNVLVEIDFSRVLSVWASYAGITAEELVPRFSLQDKDHERFERGEITSAHFFNSVRETLRIDITNAQFLEGWNSVFVGEITGIDDVVKRASLRYPLYVFSNTTLPHHVVWQNLCPELLTKFKKIFVSYELGLRKPDEEAFYAVAEAIGEPIHQILFFDDSPENVAVASRLGMQIVEVKTVQDVKERLELLL
jgi:putative hydrolase of the HAD superfamily|tara:strand:- start:195 stop:818 length:624 start_codon:yes stop_codon:yes gene_type:complete